MLSSVPGALARSEQLVRNAVDSETRGSSAASGRRPGRSGRPEYQFELSQALGLSVQISGSQTHYVSRNRFR